MIRFRSGWLSLAALLVLAACTSNREPPPVLATPGVAGVGTPTTERPVADRPPANEDERRARIHVELGEAYLQASNFGVALDEARLALGYAPNYAPAFLLVASVHMFLEDQAAARANFEQALRLAPQDPEINNTYGWFLCVSGQEKQGLERLALAARNPYYQHPARAYTNLGLCQLRIKDETAAETSFLRALQQDAGNAQALFQLADMAFRRGNAEAAQRYLVALHRVVQPSAQSAWLGLRVERRLGNREAASSYAQQLKSRHPSSPEYELLIQGKLE